VVMTKRTYDNNTVIAHRSYDENGNELISHFSHNTKITEIIDLMQGTWIYIEDTTLQITVTKKEVFISDYDFQSWGDRFVTPSGHYSYTLKYIDSTMKDKWAHNEYMVGLAGLNLYSKLKDGLGLITQIYSINGNYMVIKNDLILKRKEVHSN